MRRVVGAKQLDTVKGQVLVLPSSDTTRGDDRDPYLLTVTSFFQADFALHLTKHCFYPAIHRSHEQHMAATVRAAPNANFSRVHFGQ